MAEDREQQTAPRAAREAVQDKRESRDDETQTYPRELLVDGGLTDYPPHVVAGALAGAGATPKNLSIEEANAACKAWLKAPVQTKEG